MDGLLKYTEDKNFVRWVQKPDEKLNIYWEKYKLENPGEKRHIEEARAVILSFQVKNEKIEIAETDQLFQGIMKGIEEKKKSKPIRKLAFSILKYAAVGIFFIVTGVLIFLNQKPDSFIQNAERLLAGSSTVSGNSELVLFNGEKITIDSRLSFIEQLNNGNMVIDSKDTILVKDINETQLNQLIVPEGKNSVIKLADGSLVHINAGSKFVFPSVFYKNKRQVYLTGEGFFEVKHQSDIPFVASTNKLDIEVLGTKFNLSSYPAENSIETVLLEGKVKVKESGGNFSANEKFLNPMQKAVFNKTGNEILVSDVEDEEYVTWYKGYLSFKSKDLASIVKKLERHYDVEIKLNSPELNSKAISGKLKLQQEEIDTVIQVLANTASLSMEKQNDSTFILK